MVKKKTYFKDGIKKILIRKFSSLRFFLHWVVLIWRCYSISYFVHFHALYTSSRHSGFYVSDRFIDADCLHYLCIHIIQMSLLFKTQVYMSLNIILQMLWKLVKTLGNYQHHIHLKSKKNSQPQEVLITFIFNKYLPTNYTRFHILNIVCVKQWDWDVWFRSFV